MTLDLSHVVERGKAGAVVEVECQNCDGHVLLDRAEDTRNAGCPYCGGEVEIA